MPMLRLGPFLLLFFGLGRIVSPTACAGGGASSRRACRALGRQLLDFRAGYDTNLLGQGMSTSWVVRTPADVLGVLNDAEMLHAPRELYLRGNLALLARGPRVSVIGSREASDPGLSRARSLARVLVQHDVLVVSGLAAGIDTAAHQGTMDAGGHTVAVLGTPVDQAYPRENADLQAQIAAGHLLVSQFAPGTPIAPRNFPMRNRTMALLTDATIIVEASERSGTVYQGWEALRLGRSLFLLENVATDPRLTWPARMISSGAQVISRVNLEQTLADLRAPKARAAPSGSAD